MTRKIKWGVLGYARIAREALMPAIGRSSNSELLALASRDDGKLADARGRFPALARTYRGYEALLDDPEIDAVYIPLPNSEHCEWTRQAIARGKHVLCEKPMALNAAQCREMITAAERAGVRLMEAFMYRYTARTAAVLEVVRSGVLGEIKQVTASFRFLLANPASIKYRPELGGGCLYDVGCYPVNFIGMVMDAAAGGPPGVGKPESVAAQATWEGGVDMNFAGVLRYPSGVLATVLSGFNAHRRVLAEVVGTKGLLEVPDTYFDNAGTLTLTLGEERRDMAVAASDRYRAEVEDFAAAILEKRAPAFSLVETQRNAEVIDQLLAAARNQG